MTRERETEGRAEDAHVYVIEEKRPDGRWLPVLGAPVSLVLDDVPYALADWRGAYPGNKYRGQRYTRGFGNPPAPEER